MNWKYVFAAVATLVLINIGAIVFLDVTTRVEMRAIKDSYDEQMLARIAAYEARCR